MLLSWRFVLRFLFFFFNDTATTEIYTLSLHDALPISERTCGRSRRCWGTPTWRPRSSTPTWTGTTCAACTGSIIRGREGRSNVSRAFTKEDAGNEAPRRNYGLPPKGHADYDRAAADALLEVARAGETASAEQATGYYWGEPRLREHVRRILDRASAAGDERLQQLAERFLS